MNVRSTKVLVDWPPGLEDSRGWTPLLFAALHGDIALARILLQHGGNLRIKNDGGIEPPMVVFGRHCLDLEMGEMLWVEGAEASVDHREANLCHQLASSVSPEVSVDKNVSWLIDRAVNPYKHDCDGHTPLHKAARRKAERAISALGAVTRRSSQYAGYLMAYLEGEREFCCRGLLGDDDPLMSTALLLFKLDLDPFGQSRQSSDTLSFLLLRVAGSRLKDQEFSAEISALLQEHQTPASPVTFDLCMAFLQISTSKSPSEYREISHWLAVQLKERSLAFLRTEIWSAAIFTLPGLLMYAAWGKHYLHEIPKLFQHIKKFFENREAFGTDVEYLYGLLHCTGLRGSPLAIFVINQELARARMEFSDKIYMDMNLASYDRPHREVFISLMLDREINLNTQDGDCDLAILKALKALRHGSQKRETALLRLLLGRSLLKSDWDVNYQNDRGSTAFIVAARSLCGGTTESLGIIELLLDAGCDIDHQDVGGCTALMVAAFGGEIPFLERLLLAGCNINLQDRSGYHPDPDGWIGSQSSDMLYWYNARRHQRLWEGRCQRNGGHTAFTYAVICAPPRHEGITKLLLKDGCDTSLRNNDGYTALELARKFNEEKTIKILQDHEQTCRTQLMTPCFGIETCDIMIRELLYVDHSTISVRPFLM